jgi:hypothetical protein
MAVDFSSFEQYDALRRANRLLFQDEYEPVWIINSEEFQLKEFMQYYPDFALPEPPKPPPPPPKPGPMLVRVPMCCPDCEERLEVHLKTLPGIEKLTVDWVENKVTVIGAEKDPINAVDLLSECRKLFKKSDKW